MRKEGGMKKTRFALWTCLIAGIMTFAQVGCTGTVTEEYTFRNGGFESGTLSGWETYGEAFTNRGVSFSERDASGNYYNYEGEFFFCGAESASASATGYMLSETFRLQGNGKIGFLIGAGKYTARCYVALVSEDGEQEYAIRANDEFDEIDTANSMHRVILDGSNYIGKKVRIKVVDNDEGTDGYNYVNVDDFIVNYQGTEEGVGLIYRANQYIAKNKESVNARYRLSYHAMPEVGWCNDPNGFSYYNGQVHLFYQHNPYSSAWDTMYWGHITSNDFVKWEYQSVALAPDESYDSSGCFSGSAIVKDDSLYLMYTGVNANGLQQQCIATSSDGVNFTKAGRNPVISSSMLGSGMSAVDFRDPYVFEKDGLYYCIAGTKVNGYGNLALYTSKTLTSWEFVGYLLNNSDPNGENYYRLSGVYECPSFAVVDGQQILICSPQNLPSDGYRFQNVHSVVYMAGTLDAKTGKFTYGEMEEIDGGFDFYAAQTMTMPDGRVIMTAWMQMWDRTLPTQADGWAGAMILPRELTYKNGRLYQNPVREIEKYRANKATASNIRLADSGVVLDGFSGDTLELELELEVGSAARTGVKVFQGSVHETSIYYDAEKQAVILDRSASGVSISGAESVRGTRAVSVTPENGVIKLRIFLDNTGCEVFVNDGYATLTANIYADETDEGIEFFASEGSAVLKSAVKYDIVVS